MALRGIKDLCRLCAKKNDYSKDLIDENNKDVLHMIQEFLQIGIHKNDDLPTRVCLNCEEKIVSFHLYILECHKVQETLRGIVTNKFEIPTVKHEEISEFELPPVKSEVKDELTADDLLSAINNGETLDEMDADDDFNNSDNKQESDDDSSDVEISLAELKERKSQRIENRILSEREKKELDQVLKKSNPKLRDFVRLECDLCLKEFKVWNSLNLHCCNFHKTKAVIFCICGFAIHSKSVMYKHVSEHQRETRKLNKEVECQPDDDNPKYPKLNVKDFVNFTCLICQKQCASWYVLRSHSERIHKTKPVVYCICGVSLKSKSVLYKHVQDHKNPNIFCCDKCPRITKTEAAMNKHKMRHVPKSERKFYCSSCNKVFNSRETLKSHERSHIPIEERKIYRCEICDLKFTTRSSAASHKRVVHEKIKSYVCDLCGYACGTNGELRQHRAIHSDDKPFVCRKCPKRFKTYSNLKTHMDTHEDTSYACFICSRVLNSRRTLRKHLLVHDEKCRHVCSYCNKAFKRRQTLKVHMYTHTGDKPLSCKWCDERFSYASTLRSHRLRCHPDKMAAQYNYSHVTHAMQQDYLKNDAVSQMTVAKTDVEAIQQ